MQTSIAQKQKDAQLKNSSPLAFSHLGKQTNNSSDGGNGVVEGSFASTTGAARDSEASRWKVAYEAAMKENEKLRSRGEEAAQASQWRERFETCERERNEALDRLNSLLEPHPGTAMAAKGTGEYDAKRHDLLGPGAIYQRYLSLKEEFEVIKSILSTDFFNINHWTFTCMQIVRKRLLDAEATSKSKVENSRSMERTDGGICDGYSASRIQHSRHLVLQYLSCKDKDVRIHMEDALMALFRVTEEERMAIAMRRRLEDGSGDYMSSLSGMFGFGDALGSSQHGIGTSVHRHSAQGSIGHLPPS